jgi:hypothetical protein
LAASQSPATTSTKPGNHSALRGAICKKTAPSTNKTCENGYFAPAKQDALSNPSEFFTVDYPSDVSDEEWSLVVSYLTLMTETAPQRQHSLRELFNGLRYERRAFARRKFAMRDFDAYSTAQALRARLPMRSNDERQRTGDKRQNPENPADGDQGD